MSRFYEVKTQLQKKTTPVKTHLNAADTLIIDGTASTSGSGYGSIVIPNGLWS